MRDHHPRLLRQGNQLLTEKLHDNEQLHLYEDANASQEFHHRASEDDTFPYLNIDTITRKLNPVFPATVVGRPPKEDMFLGIAATEIFGGLIKLVNPAS